MENSQLQYLENSIELLKQHIHELSHEILNLKRVNNSNKNNKKIK